MSAAATTGSPRSVPLSIGLIGAGGISRAHARAYEQFPEQVRLAAVCDRDEAAAAAASRFGNVPVFGDIAELLRRPEIEAVDICTPHDTHAALAIAAAQAGKHILLEKPMATSMQDARAILSAVDAAGVTCMVAQHFRHVPVYAGLRDLVLAGELGTLWSGRIDNWLPSALPYARPAGEWWGLDARRAGGGVVMMQSVHHIDLFRFICGDVRSVLARTWTGSPRMRGGAEDRVVATLEFESGMVAQLSGSYLNKAPHHFQFLLMGDAGTAYTSPPAGGPSILHHQAPPLLWSRRQEDEQGERRFAAVPPAAGLPSDDPFVNEILHFARCCRDGSEPVSSGRDNLSTMKALCAIYESARSGHVVDLAGL